MLIELKNDYLSLLIQKPGEIYRGSRFDYTGQIIQVTFLKKHTFCTTETLKDNEVNKKGRGLYNEFGIDETVGYDDCPVGGKFPKIGVGLLTKGSMRSYNFFENYEVTPYSFKSSFNEAEAVFICESEKEDKYSFKLEKRIKLNRNTPIDENYKLYFPFKINPEKFKGTVNPGNIVQFENEVVSLKSVSEEQFFFSNINIDFRGKGEWMLIHSKDRIGIQEITDFNYQKINLWGTRHVISPEIFFQIKTEPGKSLSWSRTYKIFQLS
jgi:hypothetical protein